jgi:hypothetical protein
MENLFFISSSGSMATHWLSKLLSSSTQIMCFHGAKELQDKYNANMPVLDALVLLERWSISTKTAYTGITHLSNIHGVAALPTCLRADIPFCALVRNPILCTDSQFQERKISERKVAAKIERYETMWAIVSGTQPMPRSPDWNELVFFRCSELAIRHLFEIEMNDCKAFMFEKYTSNYDEIRRLLNTITGGQLSDDHNINIAFHTGGQTNAHRKIILPYTETWSDLWSDIQRQIFTSVWRHLLADNERINVYYPEVNELMKSCS